MWTLFVVSVINAIFDIFHNMLLNKPENSWDQSAQMVPPTILHLFYLRFIAVIIVVFP